MPKGYKVVTLLSFGGLAAFLYLGYLNSDAHLLQEIIKDYQLGTTNQGFQWLIRHYSQAKHSDPVHPGESIQTMLKGPRRRLWCDEGAIVMGLMAEAQGKRTRLVDLLDSRTGISHHTTLQVKQEEQWITYDFTSKKAGVPLSATVPYAATPRYRQYPETPLHWFLLHNGYARQLVSWYRNHQPHSP